MKSKADVVIIGGGIQGTSVAFHLTQQGIRDVVLIEMDLIGSGSSGRSAAMVMQSMSREETIRLSQAAWNEYMHFADIVGADVDFRRIGYMNLVTRRVQDEAHREMELQKKLGVPIEELDPHEAKSLAPILNIEDISFAAYCRQDGYIDPHAAMQGYVHAAKARGAEFYERVQATGIRLVNDRVVGVETTGGYIDTPIVVNSGGARAKEIASWVGLDLPITNYRRHIFVTEASDLLPQGAPFVMDLEAEWYFRREGAGILMGMGREESQSFEPQFEWEFLETMTAHAVHRAPALAETKFIRGWAGLRALTPDDLPVIGEAPNTRGFYNNCGWGGHGVMHGPIGGILTAEIIAGGRAKTMDASPFRVERFPARVESATHG